VLDLNPVYKTTRVLLDFTSCNVKEQKNEDHINKEFAIATNEGLCFVKITANKEVKQMTEYFLSD
jgi:hypothetical protein